MATLNLSKMKYMSETNLKKFANLIISLSSQVTDVENKCIKPYVGGELYQKDSYVSYNGYIYQATATNQDSAFDETHWDKLSDDFNELTVADIESMLGLSSEQLETMANLIADTEVRLDKTYSSSKIYQDIQQCLNDSKAFTLLELGKFSGASYKVVASTSEMTSESIIYLLASGNTYDMYIVEEDGTTTKIGDMNIDLSDYYTKAEIEADYLKKADADGKYATIVTVDGKVDKDKIATVLDDTVTDTQVASAKAVYDGLENINEFGVQVVNETLDLNDITETGIYFFPQAYTPANIPVGVNGWLLVMKGSSSNIVKQVWYRQGTVNANSYNTFERYKAGDTWGEWTKFLTEKDYYSALNSGNTTIPENADLNDYVTAGVYTCIHGDVAKTLANCPHIVSNFKLIVNKNRGNSDVFYGYQMIVGTVGYNPVKDVCIYYRGVVTTNDVYNFSKWKIMSGSTVADVPVTPINIINGIVNPDCKYQVKNGICYIQFNSGTYTLGGGVNGLQLAINMPIPASGNVYHTYVPWASSDASKQVIVFVDGNGSLLLHAPVGANGCPVFCTFSYPVAE